MQRYFVDKEQIDSDRIVIRGDDVHHIKNVMRLTEGDTILCCDGEGFDYPVRIESVGEDIVCRILDRFASRGEPSVSVTVAQSLLKGDKWDWVLQKGTELGAARFLPFTSRRTVVRLDGAKAGKRRIRWQRIVKEAAEQSRRGRIPAVVPLTGWDDLLKRFSGFDQVLFAYEKGGRPLPEVLEGDGGRNRLIVIGPEGGFAEEEAEEAVAAGAVPIQMGSRILRAETASLALLTCIMYSCGEMGGEPL